VSSDQSTTYRIAVIGMRVLSGDRATADARRNLSRAVKRLDPADVERVTERVTSTPDSDVLALLGDGTTADAGAALAARPDVAACIKRKPATPSHVHMAAVMYVLGLAFLHVESVLERLSMSA
jgi:hypothetical protein